MTAKCMAILMAVERWRRYIEHYQFIIKTGHKSLKFLLEQRTHTWVYDQSPTLARNGEDHGYIRMDKYLHWYKAFWV
jgi:hypothetical protein